MLFLDKRGLTKLWKKIKDTFVTQTYINKLIDFPDRFFALNGSIQGITEYPTDAGVYRIVGKITGLPDDASSYGVLFIVNAGYSMHICIDHNYNAWIGYTVWPNETYPSTWNKINNDNYAHVGITNSNGGGVTYYQQFGRFVYVTLEANQLLYTWNSGSGMNNSPIPVPVYEIPFYLISSDGSFTPCTLNKSGYLIMGSTGFGARTTPFHASFSYLAAK